MRRIAALVAPLALVLAGCGVSLPPVGSTAPAPLSQTVVDDVALRTAWASFEVAVDGITLLRQRGLIVAGSTRARAIASGIDRVTMALQAAEHAVTVGSTKDYSEALREAGLAIAALRAALKGN